MLRFDCPNTCMPAHSPIAARAPYTTKQPDRCPYCGARGIARKGTRRKKLEIVQLWRCKSCRRIFTPAPSELRNKTYPLRVILEGISLYNLGYSLADAAAKLKGKFGHRVSSSTLAAWIAGNRAIATYGRLRPKAKRLFLPGQTIRAVKLYHRQVYRFAYHRSKLALLRQSQQQKRFAPLADFLESLPQACPHELFHDSARASQIHPDFASAARAIVVQKENFATRTAALVLPTLGDNRLRHEYLQRFMLASDSVTIATEVPIWLTAADIAAIERHYAIRVLAGGTSEHTVTGHIDFLQVRNGAVHILDYKPDARTNRPIAQLTIYALAISRLAGIPLFDIKCAWFNEIEYCEFFPRKLLGQAVRLPKGDRPQDVGVNA
jgi:transposase-like protein